MAIPTHDSSCVTKSYETTCQYCKQPVWYFSCSCGSRLFFEDRGYPWEKHHCEKYSIRRQLLLVQNANRLSTEEIWALLQKEEKSSGLAIDDSIIDLIESITGPAKYPFKSSNVPANDYKIIQEKEPEFSGQVIEVNTQINVAKFLGYHPSDMTSRLVSRIAPGEWVRLVIRTRPNRRNEALSFIVLVPMKQWKENRITQTAVISGVLKRVTHPKGAFWCLVSCKFH